MNDALGVGNPHRFDHRNEQRQRLVNAQRSARELDVLRQIPPIEQLLHNERNALVLEHIQHVHHIGVPHDARSLRLSQKSLDDLSVARQLSMQDFDRDRPVDHDVGRAVDFPHSPCAEPLVDTIPVRENNALEPLILRSEHRHRPWFYRTIATGANLPPLAR